MSIESTLARVSAIRQAVVDPASLLGVTSAGGVEAPVTASGPAAAAPGQSAFASALARATSGSPANAASIALPSSSAALSPGLAGSPGSAGVGYAAPVQGLQGISGSSQLGSGGETPGARIVAAAETQIGQSEQPPGSNESPAIAAYRGATAGAIPGAPWCAYFASWAARQAGDPVGPQGQGLGSVSEIWSWAQAAG